MIIFQTFLPLPKQMQTTANISAKSTISEATSETSLNRAFYTPPRSLNSFFNNGYRATSVLLINSRFQPIVASFGTKIKIVNNFISTSFSNFLSFSNFYLSATNHWLSVTNQKLSVSNYGLSVTNQKLSVSNQKLSVFNYWILITNHWISITNANMNTFYKYK